MPAAQVMMFQTMAPTSAAKITCASTTAGSMMPVPTVLGDMQSEHSEGDEIEERRPEHRILRPQHPGRDDGRDRVGGVMQPVQEVEGERDRDQPDQQREAEMSIHGAAYTCSIMIELISLATSSKRSATFSRWS